MNKTTKNFLDIFVRYVIILIVAIPNLYLFYLIFTPLTIYPIYYLLNLFFDVSLNRVVLSSGSFTIELIGACIAGSAYYLLLVLNLSIPDIKFKRRIKMIFLAFIIFLIFNILRIFSLTFLLSYNFDFFDITHKIFWYSISTLLVLGIWFWEIKLFKIKGIPFYSDLKNIYRLIK